MRVYFLPTVGALVALGCLHAKADSKTATPHRIKAELLQAEPYRYNGAVLGNGVRGSGFCAWNRHTFFTAAHVVFGETTWEAPPVWFPKANSYELNESTGIQARGYFRWSEYADLASASFMNQEAFSKDVALAYAFRKFIRSAPATLNLDGSRDLKKDTVKLITGYPAVKDYTDRTLAGYHLYKTGPFTTQYGSYHGNALLTTLVSTGGGNSGGPIWTRTPNGGWNAAGILVGGLPSESVVYAFSGDTKSLLRAVEPVIQPEIQEPVFAKGVSSTSTYFPYDRPKIIPDGKHSWTSFRVRVGNFPTGANVSAVRLSLDIRTKHRGDLQVALEGPGGYWALVHNEEGAGKDNLIIHSEDYTGAFIGTEPNGEWFVRVQDRLKGDIATLKSFVLELSAEESAGPVVTP